MNALAQAPETAPTASSPSGPSDRATTFQPVEGGNETHNGTTLLVEAYAAIWLILMAWLVLVWRKQADMSRRIDGLEQALDRAAAKQAAAKPAPKASAEAGGAQ
jgi:hypothetical protein